jgi:phytoene dehydrogenase-like protein
MSERFQHIVIGGGHNGLVCATLLARRGRKVLLLESADQVGGAAITREFAPGFQVSAGAHLLHALPAELTRELQLERHGLRLSARSLPTVSLNPDGAPLVFDAVTAGAPGERLSAPDQRALMEFRRQMARFARVFDLVQSTVPFRLGMEGSRDRINALKIALRIRLLGKRDMRELLRIAGMNAYDLLEDVFTSEALKGALGFDATLGAEHGPRSPGTVLTLLARWTGLSRDGNHGVAQVAGGMGQLTQSMARAATAAGVQVRTGARVERVLVENDRASGVRLQSGETIAGDSVISNADPKTTFLKLVGAEYLDTDFVRRVDHYRAKGNVAKLHLALDSLPEFRGVEAIRAGGRMLVSPSLEALETAFNPSKYRQLPDAPVLEITIPTVHDASLAPPGKHVASILVNFVPYDPQIGLAEARAQLQRTVLEVLERHAPGIGKRVHASELLLPQDIEREFGMAGGHWHHGALSFDQFFVTRPVPGATQYATPLPGLYLCGAGAHPGGGVSGLPGRNAALRILEQGA